MNFVFQSLVFLIVYTLGIHAATDHFRWPRHRGHGNSVELCNGLINYLANGGTPRRFHFPCLCILSDLEQTESNLNTQISTLASQVQSQTMQLAAINQALATTNSHLMAVCPDSTPLRNVCNNNMAPFTFVESADGCVAICYRVVGNTLNYADAKAACTADGGSLITLDTPEKNALMVNTIRTSMTLKDRSLWIGLKFVGNQWVWEGNNAPATFTDWATDEPDTNQPCGSLNQGKHHRWFDQKCTKTIDAALCELVVPTMGG
ncbi:uncharacterized protein LOC121384613 [Gigantopelta aegis]|uniref:uncharacterized protein LOC121384613 n=1 Tax=Gigantopelta aegis TaxID=1735272 RepID=UPI001B88AC08|nr:uncharacterized protein LOC121384613 [Gigantopelta aegis]